AGQTRHSRTADDHRSGQLDNGRQPEQKLSDYGKQAGSVPDRCHECPEPSATQQSAIQYQQSELRNYCRKGRSAPAIPGSVALPVLSLKLTFCVSEKAALLGRLF